VQILTQLVASPAGAFVADFCALLGTSWTCWAMAGVIPNPNPHAASNADRPAWRSALHLSIDLLISTFSSFHRASSIPAIRQHLK
jgi:hypothetical protein